MPRKLKKEYYSDVKTHNKKVDTLIKGEVEQDNKPNPDILKMLLLQKKATGTKHLQYKHPSEKVQRARHEMRKLANEKGAEAYKHELLNYQEKRNNVTSKSEKYD